MTHRWDTIDALVKCGLQLKGSDLNSKEHTGLKHVVLWIKSSLTMMMTTTATMMLIMLSTAQALPHIFLT